MVMGRRGNGRAEAPRAGAKVSWQPLLCASALLLGAAYLSEWLKKPSASTGGRDPPRGLQRGHVFELRTLGPLFVQDAGMSRRNAKPRAAVLG